MIKGLNDEQQAKMSEIFGRYHTYERIVPTRDFVAQACFDVGWLQGLVGRLAEENYRLKNSPPSE